MLTIIIFYLFLSVILNMLWLHDSMKAAHHHVLKDNHKWQQMLAMSLMPDLKKSKNKFK